MSTGKRPALLHLPLPRQRICRNKKAPLMTAVGSADWQTFRGLLWQVGLGSSCLHCEESYRAVKVAKINYQKHQNEEEGQKNIDTTFPTFGTSFVCIKYVSLVDHTLPARQPSASLIAGYLRGKQKQRDSCNECKHEYRLCSEMGAVNNMKIQMSATRKRRVTTTRLRFVP